MASIPLALLSAPAVKRFTLRCSSGTLRRPAACMRNPSSRHGLSCAAMATYARLHRALATRWLCLALKWRQWCIPIGASCILSASAGAASTMFLPRDPNMATRKRSPPSLARSCRSLPIDFSAAPWEVCMTVLRFMLTRRSTLLREPSSLCFAKTRVKTASRARRALSRMRAAAPAGMRWWARLEVLFAKPKLMCTSRSQEPHVICLH
mmetsp:Transcript_72686/g.228987  ORF Transcript_72686/g.228987 Transcript_72686/m.228987 type:complete len:208 (+) Transcript_72686:33-656(+)